MHSTPIEFVTGVIITTLIYALIFLAVKRVAKLITPVFTKVMKYLVVLYAIAVLGSAFGSYQMTWSKPQSFQQGFVLLENSPRITSRIGKINGYSYSEKDMPDDEDNPARLVINLNGSRGDMHVDVLLSKDVHSKKWSILEFKKDSLIQGN